MCIRDSYYLAPVGEVFRTMLPLAAEFKRAVTYSITDEGHMALHLAGTSGSPARSKRTPQQQLVEFRVLDYLAERESVREASLRAATKVSKPLLEGMVRKKWIAREDVSAAQDAARTVKVARLISAEASRAPSRINENQKALIDALAAAGGKVAVESLRGLEVPRSTLGTLVRRGLIELLDEPRDFTVSKLKPRRSPFEFEFSGAQKEALAKIGEAVAARGFSGMLLHGITGSGKTAVYLALSLIHI